MSTVLIVDGNPLAWRGSVMYEGLKNGAGHLTGCIFASLENLVKGIKDVKPDATVIAWDCGKSRWRKELHPGYKIRRDSADRTAEEKAKRIAVLNQIKVVQRLFNEAGLHQISVEGVEGDDIIGVLASGFDCLETYDHIVILGGDRDLYQLVRGAVCIYDPIKKAWIGDDYVKSKYAGIGPEQIIELKALTGDTGDDIPGIDGVGTKRAAELLKKYGSLDSVFNPENETALNKYKWSQKVLPAKDIVDKARKLVTITTCVHMEQFNEQERVALARELWKHPIVDRLALSGSLDFYDMRRALENLDVLSQPSPNFEGFEQWLPSS